MCANYHALHNHIRSSPPRVALAPGWSQVLAECLRMECHLKRRSSYFATDEWGEAVAQAHAAGLLSAGAMAVLR